MDDRGKETSTATPIDGEIEISKEDLSKLSYRQKFALTEYGYLLSSEDADVVGKMLGNIVKERDILYFCQANGKKVYGFKVKNELESRNDERILVRLRNGVIAGAISAFIYLAVFRHSYAVIVGDALLLLMMGNRYYDLGYRRTESLVHSINAICWFFRCNTFLYRQTRDVRYFVMGRDWYWISTMWVPNNSCSCLSDVSLMKVAPNTAWHDKLFSLVERMLELHKRSPHTPQEQKMVKREIESTDGRIDGLAYELYGLTEDEIRIVES
jgi:hypothetical protein